MQLETGLHSYHHTPRHTQNIKASTLRFSTTMQAVQLATVVLALKDAATVTV
jgi:hypothetical protein